MGVKIKSPIADTVKIKFPIADTESGYYDYGRNLSDEEYLDMFIADFRKNESDMRQVENIIRENGRSLEKKYNISDIRRHNGNSKYSNVQEKVTWIENDASVSTMEHQNVSAEYLMEKAESKDMDILEVNFLYDGYMDNDLESELRYWTEDSCLVRKDHRLDSKTRVKRLPPMNMKIVIDDDVFNLFDCKIVKDNSDRRNPFNLTLLINKIEKEN